MYSSAYHMGGRFQSPTSSKRRYFMAHNQPIIERQQYGTRMRSPSSSSIRDRQNGRLRNSNVSSKYSSQANNLFEDKSKISQMNEQLAATTQQICRRNSIDKHRKHTIFQHRNRLSPKNNNQYTKTQSQLSYGSRKYDLNQFLEKAETQSMSSVSQKYCPLSRNQTAYFEKNPGNPNFRKSQVRQVHIDDAQRLNGGFLDFSDRQKYENKGYTTSPLQFQVNRKSYEGMLSTHTKYSQEKPEINFHYMSPSVSDIPYERQSSQKLNQFKPKSSSRSQIPFSQQLTFDNQKQTNESNIGKKYNQRSFKATDLILDPKYMKYNQKPEKQEFYLMEQKPKLQQNKQTYSTFRQYRNEGSRYSINSGQSHSKEYIKYNKIQPQKFTRQKSRRHQKEDQEFFDLENYSQAKKYPQRLFQAEWQKQEKIPSNCEKIPSNRENMPTSQIKFSQLEQNKPKMSLPQKLAALYKRVDPQGKLTGIILLVLGLLILVLQALL